VEAFVEEEVGEMIDNEDEVDAFEALRPRRTISLGPAECEEGESLRLRKCVLTDDGPAVIPTVVSIARRECIAQIVYVPMVQVRSTLQILSNANLA
jgi:hypothetical protein